MKELSTLVSAAPIFEKDPAKFKLLVIGPSVEAASIANSLRRFLFTGKCFCHGLTHNN